MKPLLNILKDQSCAQREFPLQQAGCSPRLPVSTCLSGDEGKTIASSSRIIFLSLIMNPGGLPCSSSGYSSDPQTLFVQEILSFDTYTGLLTDQEQGQLARLVSPVDINRIPERWSFTFRVYGYLNCCLWLLSSLWASIICAYQCGIPEFYFSHLKDSDFLIEGCQVCLMKVWPVSYFFSFFMAQSLHSVLHGFILRSIPVLVCC